jgi:hypothetical protein
MSRCPYHRSDFCTHGGQTVTTEAEPTAPVIRCACGKPATVTLTYLPRPLPLFGSAVTVSLCPECYSETIKRGQLLSQEAIR